MSKQSVILIAVSKSEDVSQLNNILAEGYRIQAVSSGQLALEAVQKILPDLILLDAMADDLEVCQKLKADAVTKAVPVIFMASQEKDVDKKAVFSAGGSDLITKPFEPVEVLAKVDTQLRLVDQSRQLQLQSQELDAFAHTVSHDLKSSLARMMTSLSLVQEYSAYQDYETQKLLQMSFESSLKMNSFINELMLLTSVRKESIQTGPVAMVEVVNRSLNRLAQLVETTRPKFSIPDEWPEALGYGPWLEEVWVNYLSNGLKYGGQPPQLQLGADLLAEGQLRFWVKDNGPGLSPEAQAGLFTEFTRPNSERAEGRGLGLSIVRRIMDKQGGQCGVESTLGQGSTFYFTLPAA